MASSEKRVPPHLHCRVCGKAIPPNREFCSNECRQREERSQRRVRRMSRIYTLSFILLMLILLIFTLARPPS